MFSCANILREPAKDRRSTMYGTTAKTHVLMCKHSERTCKRQKVNNVWQPASNKQFSYYTIITWAPSCLGCKPISELGMLLLVKKERFQYKKPKSPPTKTSKSIIQQQPWFTAIPNLSQKDVRPFLSLR
jgi:hypothetical protein